MQARRNAPCTCGSGKKFKHCHGAPAHAQVAPDEATWRRVRSALDGYPAMLLRFIARVYGSGAIDEAWDEFTLWSFEGSLFDPDTPHIELFMPWFFHSWAPDPAETSVEDESLYDRSPTSVLLERRAARLDPVLRRYLEACVDAPFSFHEVLRCDPGRALWTRDLFTRTEHEVLERSVSRTLSPGDAFFGQLVSSEGITLIEACGSLAIPPGEKIGLIDLRERMSGGRPISAHVLKEWDIEIREAYLDLADQLENPRPPRLQNTDGEDIVFHHLVFEIDSPSVAVAALADLALDGTEDDLLEQAEFHPDGEVRRVTFDWKAAGNAVHKAWDNTVHGHIEIDRRELRAEVNSAERAERLRGLLEQRLGEGIRYQHTRIESVEEAMSKLRSEPEGGTHSAPDIDSPELREKLRELTEAHYDGWVTEPIPALDGLTPMEAVRDPVGREKADALIAGMEGRGATSHPPLDDTVFARVRERLGLERPEP
jgi:hypothetical protein